jgi:hypothetical protein
VCFATACLKLLGRGNRFLLTHLSGTLRFACDQQSLIISAERRPGLSSAGRDPSHGLLGVPQRSGSRVRTSMGTAVAPSSSDRS